MSSIGMHLVCDFRIGNPTHLLDLVVSPGIYEKILQGILPHRFPFDATLYPTSRLWIYFFKPTRIRKPILGS